MFVCDSSAWLSHHVHGKAMDIMVCLSKRRLAKGLDGLRGLWSYAGVENEESCNGSLPPHYVHMHSP